MSDIDIKFEWWQLLALSPMVGWPGLLLGGLAGALAWRTRRVLAGIAGAIIGNLAWAYAAIMLK
jgi:hypothetical protein